MGSMRAKTLKPPAMNPVPLKPAKLMKSLTSKANERTLTETNANNDSTKLSNKRNSEELCKCSWKYRYKSRICTYVVTVVKVS